MTGTLNFIRQHIKDMPPYKPIYPLGVLSKELGIPVENLVKLDANENPFGPIPEVVEALAKMNSLHIYPDPESRKIRALLAQFHKTAEENIVISAGADELIDLIIRITLDPGDKIINCPPTFGMYDFDAKLNQAEIIKIPRNLDFSLNIQALLEAVDLYKPKLLFLANPNNPDGSVLTQKDLEILVNLPILLIIDEAYIEFADQVQSSIPLISNYQNVIVLRTFSKWAGLAGLRIGYGVFSTELTPYLMKAKQPYNVSIAAEIAAVATLKNLSKSRERIEQIIGQRQVLSAELRKISWLEIYPSQANFVLCKVVGRSASSVRDQLRRQGILVRYFDKPGLTNHIRISVGTATHNQQLLTTLKGLK